jgi:hypothetical protein
VDHHGLALSVKADSLMTLFGDTWGRASLNGFVGSLVMLSSSMTVISLIHVIVGPPPVLWVDWLSGLLISAWTFVILMGCLHRSLEPKHWVTSRYLVHIKHERNFFVDDEILMNDAAMKKELVDWLAENVRGRWRQMMPASFGDLGNGLFMFSRANEAIHFKLRWG